MARRRGGSFNSILGRGGNRLARGSPVQRTTARDGGNNSLRGGGRESTQWRGEKERLRAYFSRAWLSDGTGVPLPLGNIVLCGWTAAFSFFFPRYFICQIIAAATLSRSNHTPAAQPDDSTEPGPGGEGGAKDDGCRAQPIRKRQWLLRSAFVAFPVSCFDDMCDDDTRQLLKKFKVCP